MDFKELGANQETDYYYYNVVIENKTASNIDGSFREDRIQPYLENYQDFQLSIVRFKVPSILIPLFYFKNPSPYYISVQLGANLVVKQVLFDATIANDPNQAIYYYSQFLQMVNNTLESAITDLKALVPAPYNTMLTPQITYDPSTKLFSFLLDATTGIEYYPNPAGLKFYMSSELYYFFIGFPSINTNISNSEKLLILKPDNTQIQSSSVYPNFAVPNYLIPADHSSLYMWQKLSRIVIGTTMPIVQEDIGIEFINGGAIDGKPITQAILTDFEVQPSPQEQREYIYYTPESSSRYVNFLGNGNLNRVDLYVYWQDNDLNTYRMSLPPSFEIYIKLQFKRKKARMDLQRSTTYLNKLASVMFEGKNLISIDNKNKDRKKYNIKP